MDLEPLLLLDLPAPPAARADSLALEAELAPLALLDGVVLDLVLGVEVPLLAAVLLVLMLLPGVAISGASPGFLGVTEEVGGRDAAGASPSSGKLVTAAPPRIFRAAPS